MRKVLLFIIIGLALTLALSLFAQEKPSCPNNPEDCIKKIATKAKSVGWLGIESEKGADNLPLVKAVVPGSPAEKAGFLPGDQIMAINGVELKDENKDAIAKAKMSLKVDSEVTYTVKRAGGVVKLQAKLEMMPEKVVKQWIVEHLEKEHGGAAKDKLKEKGHGEHSGN